ncbi:hypothetical protein SAMN05518672_102522 [Chitinophaga sp. CF118]|uniref:hypothetical protein n=1 Tax=Chitinophaga sp. CF118 TaxID=1884367 RepID=UPI0008E2D31A|nr:hypothetical protein [Chitinophaga sp. CF118]SFD58985.1 hypothetical protein SAMN05518672_102522 [Chitinophaga sp. CF118]
MTHKLAALFPILFATLANAQKIPLKAGNWDFKPNMVEFSTYKDVPAMKILSRGQVVLKDLDFSNGTIEYDMDPVDSGFTLMYFRRSSEKESECFYFRTANAGNRFASQAIQYAPILKGVNLWDMLPEYQSNAAFERKKWNHVKLVISGKQMLAYVNNETALEIPNLEADSQHGTIAFEGQVIISNLVVKPGETERLSPVEGIDLTDNDPRYLRKWQIGKVINAPGEETGPLPVKETPWDTIIAERRGLINLTRLFGGTKERRFVWLKTNIHSSIAQIRKLNLGFSDDVSVLINGKYLYVDKNMFGSPIMKQPEGRCSLENTSFNIPLNVGNNELLIGVANDFYGWGIIARLDKMDSLEIEE